MIGVIELTELRKLDGGLLTKRISLGDDGKLKSDGSACRLVVGMARRMVMNGSNPAGTLADRLNGMGSHVALTLGQMSAAVGDECHIASRKELAACAEWVGDVITRTLDYFSFSKGPGWAVVDFDRKGMPASVQARLAELGGFQAALRSLIAGLDGVAIVTRGSSSDGIRNTETGERYPGSGGMHVYILLEDQSDAPRLLKALHERAMLAGLGWVMVGTAGQLLERSIIDTAVGSPERLVFEGTPEVLSPLQQDQTKRRAVASKATAPLDSRVAVPDLTLAERREYDRLVNVERARLKPEAEARLKREGAKRGPDGERILREAVTKQILSGSMQLQFDTLGTVTVDAVMTDPGRYNGETLADPIEGVAYGTNKAKLFVNVDGSVVVNSFAHGGRTFRLRHSVVGVEDVLKRAGKDAGKIYIGLLLAAELSQAEEEQILNQVHDQTHIGKRALKADLKAARTEAARARVKEHTAPDGRVIRLAPDKDGERSPIVAEIEATLRQESPPTVFKDIAGEVVRVVSKPSALFHLLTSDTAAGGVHADRFAPAPASPLISHHTVDSMREVLEARVCYQQHTKDAVREVTLPDSFIGAFLAPRLSSTLPLLTDISDVPVVTPKGTVIVAGGYHADSGISFTCTEAEAKAVVPDDVVPDADAVREAYRFLADEMFADVAFADRDQGVAAAVAFMLTLMNVPVLPEKPVVNFTAPLRGSGKTTAINMIIRTITRRSAAAAAWSTNPEERRKTLFAIAREGHPLAPFDNIMRGTTIRCATIERFSTSAEASDRVLGESRTETVRTPLVVMNGNALVMGGDLGSRTLTIELKADRTDPENRKFKHPDILGWCDRKLTKILKAALTILLGNPMLRDKTAVPQTRFKAWHVLVGSAVEHAAKLAGMEVRMKDLFAKSESEDEVTATLADLVEQLREAFPGREFTIEELVRLLNHPTNGVLLLETVNSLGGQPLRLVTAKTVGPVLVRYVKGRPIAGADGDTWTIAPRKRTSGKQKIVWEISGRKAGYSGSL